MVVSIFSIINDAMVDLVKVFVMSLMKLLIQSEILRNLY